MYPSMGKVDTFNFLRFPPFFFLPIIDEIYYFRTRPYVNDKKIRNKHQGLLLEKQGNTK